MNNELATVTERVISFYSDFNKKFSAIDNLFSDIDKSGGRNDLKIIQIIEELKAYHSQTAKYPNIENDNRTDVEFDEWLRLIDSDHLDINKNIQIMRSIQKRLRAVFTEIWDWSGKKACVTTIGKSISHISHHVKNNTKQELDDRIYEIAHVLRELVADCAIVIYGLEPLSKWEERSDNYVRLSADEQLIVLINKAVLIDRLYFCLPSLKILLGSINKKLDAYIYVDWNIYYAIGLLNFKIHEYEWAKKYFIKVRECDIAKNTNEDNYFHSCLLVAYCEEYSGKFDLAIKTIALDISDIDKILVEYDLSDIHGKVEEIEDRIIMGASQGSLVKQYFGDSKCSDFLRKIRRRQQSEYEDERFEILHVLSHCLNEYAIKNELDSMIGPNNGSLNAKRITLARLIMSGIAECRSDYWTCFAEIHGEDQDYGKALEELDRIPSYFEKNNEIIKETVIAEINFFKYYFRLATYSDYYAYKDSYEQFKRYYQKYDDDDARCHLKIFEFRHELRQFFMTFLNRISDMSEQEEEYKDDPIEKSLEIPDSLRQQYNELCELRPTLYMNINVRNEWHLMQRAFDCIVSLRDYLVEKDARSFKSLRNQCERYNRERGDSEKKGNALSMPGLNDSIRENNDNNDDIVPEQYKELHRSIFDNKDSISYSLYSSDSIFILAPISGIVVYQYQTGNIKQLFKHTDILPKTQLTNPEEIGEFVKVLEGGYAEIKERYQQPTVNKIPWDKLSKYSETIYYWDKTFPAQLLVARNNDAGGTSLVRKIKDVKRFRELLNANGMITKKKICTLAQRSRANCNVRINDMTEWMEIINETGSTLKICYLWKDDAVFIVPVKGEWKSNNRHDLHDLLDNIKIKYNALGSDETDNGFKKPEKDESDSGFLKPEKMVLTGDISESTDELVQKCRTMLGLGHFENWIASCNRMLRNNTKGDSNYNIWEKKKTEIENDKKQLEDIVCKLRLPCDISTVEDYKTIIGRIENSMENMYETDFFN